MSVLKILLLTGRTRRQGVGLEAGKLSDIYEEATTQIRLDLKDMEKLKIEPGDVVEVTTQYGSVVLRAEEAPRPSVGIGFVPYGPWANCLIGGDTDSTGMPTMKGLPATVKPAPDKAVLSLRELFTEMRSSTPT
ncbi:MAG: molybdopterin dinucleotide binding domain-containing protein [Candidatus Hodarchaeota archaeon]